MKAVGYVRVSTTGQVTDGVSLEAQRARIEAWCEANGYELAELYTDAGLSGKRADNRPELQAALKHVTRDGGALVVYSLSRLARSTRETLELAERLDKAGADLVSLSERIDTTSAAGRMVFRMLAVLAEFERDLTAERTREALSHKRLRGERTGGDVPFGHRLASDGRTLEADQVEQLAVAKVRELRDCGLSLRGVAVELERRGVPSRTGRPWTHRGVARALNSAERWGWAA